jgi:hypothetical protein
MPTSNSVDFTINDSECVRLAFQLIGILGEGDQLASYDYDLGKKMLNLMIKAWQMQDNHLWVKQTATMFFQKGQNTYEISSTSTDHFTVNTIVDTTISVAQILGDTAINVTSSTGMTAGDHIGIAMDNGYIHWSTISIVNSSILVTIASPLTYAAAINSNVFSYTDALINPFQVYAMTRKYIVSNIDVPLNMMSYREYFDQPNKISEGVPTMWSYDRQLDKYIIKVWPTPADTQYYSNLIVSRKIQDMDVASDNFDLPQEWGEAIVYNLAVRLSPSYGKAQGENFAELRRQAETYKQEAMSFDNEIGSLYLQPSGDGFRRP